MIVDSSSKHQLVGKSQGRLKRTHKVSKLIQLVDKATRNFVAVGEQIANENPEFQVSQSTWTNILAPTIQALYNVYT